MSGAIRVPSAPHRRRNRITLARLSGPSTVASTGKNTAAVCISSDAAPHSARVSLHSEYLSRNQHILRRHASRVR